MRNPLVIGNWKLNGSTTMVHNIITVLRKKLTKINGCNIVIAPPTIYLSQVKHAIVGSPIELGAQNVDTNVSGAFTGEISAQMLKDVGAKYIIIGHSERRTYHKEHDECIAKKFSILKEIGLIPVLCIGENASEKAAGKTQAVCARQIDAVLNTFGVEGFREAVIAYEPIWAIGTGKSATPEQAQRIHEFIRKYIANKNIVIAEKLTIQYGGSVNEHNAAELFNQPDIDGALVGGASLKADTFSIIIKAAVRAKKQNNLFF
ncbi:Triosephosphate isomerase [Candidatus Hartigia pinicola]|nr:Triosephosphate isomerase [Candidatus Hartigia pinicola]